MSSSATPVSPSSSDNNEDSQSNFSIHNFSDKILDHVIHFHVLKMCDSFLLWIGTSPKLTNLAVAVNTKYDTLPSSAALIGDRTDTASTSLAQKLAKKTGKQVFVSCNLPENQQLLPLVEKLIITEMNTHPDRF